MIEPIMLNGAHSSKCTQNGGSCIISVIAANIPANVPIIIIAKNAGPSAVSYLLKSSPQ